ncbi:class I SAM-dependent methyltransferase [Neokomagataea anthophila]|uniref:Methyltransferase domain-containing protein n=1 Tax=Neokomagataea anthophila TaxID=2826925 RepID=A0ABS5E568_9PROT|nr:methyltransferase domain-containing protein [Neokomagataea anthophila]MBR0559054.1 methyltransferase domain-containing protein [Neokomagataea anthophila]
MQTNRLHTPDISAFYRTPVGQRVQTLLQRHIKSLPFPPCQQAIALGHATPYRRALPDNTIFAHLTPPSHQEAGQKHCIVDTTRLPFDDCSVPLILAVHALEFAPSPSELLRALWKSLRDDGHLILVIPNRSGLWAHSDRTPFGHGTPFSTQQIQRLLTQNLFKTDYKRSTLIAPPCMLTHSSGRMIEYLAPYLPSPCAGLHLLVVRKNLYAGLPLAVSHKAVPSARQITAAAWSQQDPSAS